MFFLLPSTGISKKSGHSPHSGTVRSCRGIQVFKSAEEKNAKTFPSLNNFMIHFRVGACQTTLGSRLPPMMCGSTGLFSYFVHVRPRSLLKARHWLNFTPFDSGDVSPAAV